MRQSCAELLAELKKKTTVVQSVKLDFAGVDDDVYNITAPFLDGGQVVLAGRVEPRESEFSRVVFFAKQADTFVPRLDVEPLPLQDPFVTRIRGELIVGGVEVFQRPDRSGLGWRTRFYRGSSLSDLTPFACGPGGMKDIRLIELGNGSIGIFTRPQGDIGGRGTIGFTKISDIEELTPKRIAEARLLDQFVPDEWGGANEVHVLKNGLLGVLGHVACFDKIGHRHYYPMTFAFDADRETIASPLKLILAREYLPSGPAKRPDLVDVIFSGGLVRHPNGMADFYAGVSDAEAYKIQIEDPFLEYER